METRQCPKCNETIATTETTCPACKVIIADFVKLADDIEAANRYIAGKQPQPEVTPEPHAKQHSKRSLLRNLPDMLKRKR